MIGSKLEQIRLKIGLEVKMALNGLAPIILFKFYKEIEIPAFLRGFITATKIPFFFIPIYLNEKINYSFLIQIHL